MMNAMNKVLGDCILDITMPFLDDIPINGCPKSEKNDLLDQNGCRGFVTDHIRDCEMVLQRLEGVGLTFGQQEIFFSETVDLRAE